MLKHTFHILIRHTIAKYMFFLKRFMIFYYPEKNPWLIKNKNQLMFMILPLLGICLNVFSHLKRTSQNMLIKEQQYQDLLLLYWQYSDKRGGWIL